MKAANGSMDACVDMTGELGIENEYVYMSRRSPYQDVISGYGRAN
jgi:hypothetical protein